jgi:hypothetical protein
VAGYNDKSCPDTVKAQILSDPRAALKRMADKRRGVNADRAGIQKADSPQDVSDIIRSTRLKMIACHRVFCVMPPHEVQKHGEALKELESSMLALITIIRCIFSQGKMEVDHRVG